MKKNLWYALQMKYHQMLFVETMAGGHFCIQGILEFSLIGILSKIVSILADHHISIYAVSTYNTDYIFLKKENYQKGLEVLEAAGYQVID